MSPAVIDLSAHILPGFPGGPADLDEALDLARGLADAGTHCVVATPRLNSGDPSGPATADAAHAALMAGIADAGIALDVLPGAELTLDALADLPDDLLHRCTLGGGGRWLMVTLPDAGWPLSLPGRMAALEMQGLGIVLAHVEQTESVQLNPDRLRDLIGRGALVQVDASSLGGWHGARAERSAFGLLRAGMATFIASGARVGAPYPLGLEEGITAVEAVMRRPRDEVMWMVDGGPRQVVAGQPVRAPRLVPVPRGGFDPA